jgi:hypothetical protein
MSAECGQEDLAAEYEPAMVGIANARSVSFFRTVAPVRAKISLSAFHWKCTHNDAIQTNQVIMKTFKYKPKEIQAEELRPRNAQRADIIPTEGFAIVVDGKLKGNFADEQAAKAAGEELLEKFPMLRVEVHNAETGVRTKVDAVS